MSRLGESFFFFYFIPALRKPQSWHCSAPVADYLQMTGGKNLCVYSDHERDSNGPKNVRRITIIFSLSFAWQWPKYCKTAHRHKRLNYERNSGFQIRRLGKQAPGKQSDWEIAEMRDEGDVQILYLNWQKLRLTPICARDITKHDKSFKNWITVYTNT